MSENKDKLIVMGRMEQGFGVIPKLVMKDERLTIHAKCIYAYFCSYAGNGTTAFPTVSKIVFDLKISRETFNKHIKLLKLYGYIKAEQQRGNKGTFARNVYTLCEVIEEIDEESVNQPTPISPYTVSSTTDIKVFDTNNKKSPSKVLPTSVSPKTVSSGTAEMDTNINSIYNNNNINNNIDKNNSIYIRPSDSHIYTNNKKKSQQYSNPADSLKNLNHIDNKSITNYNIFRERIQDNISYSHYLKDLDLLMVEDDTSEYYKLKNKVELIDDMIEIMIDVLMSEGDIKINGEVKCREVARNIYLKLTNEHIEYAYNNFINTKTVVKNKKGYLQTILYNSYLEYRADLENFGKTYMLRK